MRSASTLAGLLAIDGLLDGVITGRGAGWVWAVPHVVASVAILPVSWWMAAGGERERRKGE